MNSCYDIFSRRKFSISNRLVGSLRISNLFDFRTITFSCRRSIRLPNHRRYENSVVVGSWTDRFRSPENVAYVRIITETATKTDLNVFSFFSRKHQDHTQKTSPDRSDKTHTVAVERFRRDSPGRVRLPRCRSARHVRCCVRVPSRELLFIPIPPRSKTRRVLWNYNK